jgi:hypothetical protein
MDQQLLRSYLATLYELPSPRGAIRASLDGETLKDPTALPELLQTTFAILTAYNPRSMLLPRKVNDARLQVMRDLLILGCYRVEPTVGFEIDKKESVWREPGWLVHGMDREEAVSFGRVFRQNTVIFARDGRPEIIVTDPTADDIGRTFECNWRVRA